MTHHSVFKIKLDKQIRVFHLEKEELERGWETYPDSRTQPGICFV